MPKNLGLYNNDLSVPRKKDIDDLADVVDGKYSATNPPPYPVTSVNGQTGAVTVESGGVNIVTQPNQPSGQSSGDFWYETELNALMLMSPTKFSIQVSDGRWDGTMEYSTDGKNWAVLDTTTSIININSGVLYMRGTENTIVTGNSPYGWVEIFGDNISCYGNIENLLDYKTVEAGEHPVMGDYAFAQMFYGKSIITPPKLPATDLSVGCYLAMFRNCTRLTTPPELPATTLSNSCYYRMFSDCTSLTIAPELPATTLVGGCYDNMFYGCTSLTTAPSLPATELTGSSYNSMFYGCSALTTVPRLPATNLPSYVYTNMFRGCKKIKLSETQTGEYTQPYRIPTSGTGSGQFPTINMFETTGGTFTGTPSINTTYYLSSSNTIA